MKNERMALALGDCARKYYGSARSKPLKNEQEAIKFVWKEIAADRSRAAFPNCYAQVQEVECDLLTLDRAGLTHEWEIKRSAADFRKDAEKLGKRELYQRTFVSQLQPGLRYKGFVPNRYTMILVDGDRWFTDKDWELIPDYAGVTVIQHLEGNTRPLVDVLKSCQTMHKAKLPPECLDRLFISVCHRFMGSPWEQSSYDQLPEYII